MIARVARKTIRQTGEARYPTSSVGVAVLKTLVGAERHRLIFCEPIVADIGFSPSVASASASTCTCPPFSTSDAERLDFQGKSQRKTMRCLHNVTTVTVVNYDGYSFRLLSRHLVG